MRVLHLIREGWDREVEVAQGITLLHYPADHPDYPTRWAIRHACPGVFHEDDEVVVIAPIVASDEVSSDPLTINPSILCMGSRNDCGLHGFVVSGQWQDAGTPSATMLHVRKA